MTAAEEITYAWRAPITDDEMVGLVRSHGGRAVAGWWDRIQRYSLGWVSARDAAGCEWLHVDFEPELRRFYLDACGFRPTDAGLIRL
jgi:hypothetical protein